MKIIITEEQKNKLFIPRKLSDDDSRYAEWNKEQPVVDGKRINQYDSEGRKDGYWETDNGELFSKVYYKNGVRDGIWEIYWNSGDLYYKGMYINGKKDGLWEWYYEDGLLMGKRIYKNGKTVW
jgi:antitoxin component YwqK of YwqJK toxin-antitoxin module